MGKSIVCTTKGQEFAKAVPSDKLHRAKHVKPASRNRVSCREKAGPSGVRVKSERVKQKAMDTWGNDDRIPLAQVVSELVKGWFQEALKEAKAGDTNMQVLVGQMGVLGLVKLQGADLQYGKLVISIQVITLVTPILMN
ncbi:hypothetical protein ES319_D06G195800v1 [Gossypium barbadense]|uniref:Uncharacterized protein n=1 Tax=Gossypium barbadense TaxID=3634 RepID=A0A5J5R4S5_GOSBA|nr:hypothetical protein ES319_D06G195800v1 [Gossypium barbadense]